MSDPSLTDLKAISVLAMHRNFRTAAVELGMSSSALSRSVAASERRVGVRLFNRTTRSVSLTEAGERFLLRIRPALDDISLAIDEAGVHRSTPAGTLRLNAEEGMSRQILEPVILEYVRRYPDMRVDLVSDGEFIDIVKQGFDAGMRFAAAVPQDMVAVPLGPEQSMAVVASPRYLAGRDLPKTPVDLMSHECIRLRVPSGKIYRWEFSRHGEKILADVDGRLTVDTYMIAIDCALAGFGVAYTGEWFVNPLIREGKLVRLLEDWTPAFPGLRLYYPSRTHLSAGLRAFIDLAKSQRVAEGAMAG